MRAARKGIRYLTFAIVASTLAVPAGAAAPDTAELRHLVRAAAHLEKAGRHELAAQVYALVATEAAARQQRLLDGSRQPPEQVGGQTRLPRDTTSPAAQRVSEDQVTIEVKLVEFSWGKLQQSGMNLVSLQNLFDAHGNPAVVDEHGQIAELIELLCREGLARVLSKPKLITLSGQPAAFEIGQDFGTLPPDAYSRTRLECTPRVIDHGKLSLDMDFGLQIAAHELARQQAGDQTSDERRSFGVKTQVEIESGNTVILGGLSTATESAAGSDATSLLLLCTARVERVAAESHAPKR